MDPSRRRFLRDGALASAATAGLSVRTASATPLTSDVSWSTWRACPGDVVRATARVHGTEDGAVVELLVRRPDGSSRRYTAPVRQGVASCAVRLSLPRACEHPGMHEFELTAKLLGRVLGTATVEVVAARFAFGL